MIQLLATIGRTKTGKLLYILIVGVFLQGFSQNYGAYTESWSTNPRDTAYILRGSNGVHERNKITGILQFSYNANPIRHIPYWLVNSWPSNFDSATMQTKLSKAQADILYQASGSNNVYNAGYGVTKTGTEPNATFSINTTDIMTAQRAADSIASLETKLNGKVPSTRTITINGDTKDLSANRSWTVSATPTYTFNNNVARTLNSPYTISATKDARVTYSVSLSVTNPLLAGTSTASAFLEYSVDAGTNWITVAQAVNSSSVALTVTVQIAQPNTFVLSGIVPSNALVRIRTTTSGTASASYVRGQEVI